MLLLNVLDVHSRAQISFRIGRGQLGSPEDLLTKGVSSYRKTKRAERIAEFGSDAIYYPIIIHGCDGTKLQRLTVRSDR